MLLWEIFSDFKRTVPIEKRDVHYGRVYECYIKSKRVKIFFEHDFTVVLDDEINYDSNTGEDKYTLVNQNAKSYELRFDVDGSMGVTGRGDTVEIFNNVLWCVNDFINTNTDPILEIWFSGSSKKSRIKFYNRLSTEICDIFHWYRIVVDEGYYTCVNPHMVTMNR